MSVLSRSQISLVRVDDGPQGATGPQGPQGPQGAQGETGAQGPQGDDGDDGISVTSVQPQYYLSTSSQSATGGSWSNSMIYTTGKYIWTREEITYSDNTVDYSTEVYNQALTESCEDAAESLELIQEQQEYFWHDSNGAHVLGDVSGYRNDITSTGMKIVNVADASHPVAEFGTNGGRIGAENKTNMVFNDKSISAKTANDPPYFQVGTVNGVTQIFQYTGDGTTFGFQIPTNYDRDIRGVKINDEAVAYNTGLISPGVCVLCYIPMSGTGYNVTVNYTTEEGTTASQSKTYVPGGWCLTTIPKWSTVNSIQETTTDTPITTYRLFDATYDGMLVWLETPPSAGDDIKIEFQTNSSRSYFNYGENEAVGIGSDATVIGHDNNAYGLCSFAIGKDAHACGDYSLSIGHGKGYTNVENWASHDYSEASGSNSIAIGSSVEAFGTGSFAMGSFSRAGGSNSVVIGDHSKTMMKANGSIVLGHHLISTRWEQIVIGRNNDYSDIDDKVFVLGNGSANRSNAMTVGWNGDVEVGGDISDGSGNILSNKAEESIVLELVERLDRIGQSARIRGKNAAADNTLTLATTVKNVLSAQSKGQLYHYGAYTAESETTQSNDYYIMNPSNGSITIKKSGVYLVNWIIYFYSGFTAGDNVYSRVYLNGSDVGTMWVRNKLNGSYHHVGGNQIGYFSANDVLTLMALNQTAARGVVARASSTYMEISCLG